MGSTRSDIYADLIYCHPRQLLKRSGVYAIIHAQSGRTYIGRTMREFVIRWQKHISELERGEHPCTPLLFDWRRYGWTAFRFQVLDVIEGDNYQLRLCEWTHIKSLNNPYNLNFDEPIPTGMIRRP
jgi:hypothetical protein